MCRKISCARGACGRRRGSVGHVSGGGQETTTNTKRCNIRNAASGVERTRHSVGGGVLDYAKRFLLCEEGPTSGLAAGPKQTRKTRPYRVFAENKALLVTDMYKDRHDGSFPFASPSCPQSHHPPWREEKGERARARANKREREREDRESTRKGTGFRLTSSCSEQEP